MKFSAWKCLSAFSWLLYPHRKAVVEGRYEREEIDKEENPILFPAYPSLSQRKLQHQSCSGKLWKEGKLPSYGLWCTHLPRALEALHSLLVSEATQIHSIHLYEPIT